MKFCLLKSRGRWIVRLILPAVFFLLSSFVLAHSVKASQTMDITTSAGIKYVGTTFNVGVRVNLGGASIDTVSLRNLNFDHDLLEITATSVGTLFNSQATLKNTTDNSAGTKRLDIGKLPTTDDYTNNSAATFTTLTFKVKSAGAGTTTLSIDYDGSPGKSGVFLSGENLLDSVGSLDIVLAEDNTAPVINNCSPVDGSTGELVTVNVVCDVTDAETGVYLEGTTLTVDGTVYSYGGSNKYTSVAITNGYRLTVDPANNLSYNTAIEVSGTAKDNAYDNGPVLARNTGTLTTYTFTTEDDDDGPSIYNQNPASGATGVSVSTNISFNIRDIASPGGYNGLGVDIDSVQVIVSAGDWDTVTYTHSGAKTFSHSGDQYDYAITINPSPDFPQNTIVEVSILANDLHSPANTLSTSYSFTTGDTQAMTCFSFNPSQGSVTMDVNSISFTCKDTGAGVNIDNLSVVVDKITYTKSGSNKFTYSGDSSSYNIVITKSSGFSPDYAFEVILNGKDLSGNAMSQVSYGLATGRGCTGGGGGGDGGGGSGGGGVGGGGPVYNTSSPSPTFYASPWPTISVPRPTRTPSYVCPTISPIEYPFPGDLFPYQVPFAPTTGEMKSVVLKKVDGANVEGLSIFQISRPTVTLEGEAEKSGLVGLLIEPGPIIAQTMADDSGQWKVTLSNVLAGADNVLYSVSRDPISKSVIQKKFLIVLYNSFNNLDAYFELQKQKARLWYWLVLILVILFLVFLRSLHKAFHPYEDEKK